MAKLARLGFGQGDQLLDGLCMGLIWPDATWLAPVERRAAFTIPCYQEYHASSAFLQETYRVLRHCIEVTTQSLRWTDS